MLALQSLKDPRQASYHNHTARELALAFFSLVAVEGHASVEAAAAPLRAQAFRALDNLLEQTELVNPDGGYHESTDYMRITWAPLAIVVRNILSAGVITVVPGPGGWAHRGMDRWLPVRRAEWWRLLSV